MDDIDFIDEQLDTLASSLNDEQMRLKVAFGDDVAQRFLKLRGIQNQVLQEAVLERHAARQAAKIAREAIAFAFFTSAG